MPVDLRETRLPGVGVKYTIRTAQGGRLAVIQHNDGLREIYFYRRSQDDEPTAVIAILREPEPVSGAQPEDRVQRGDTLVAVGKAGQFVEFRRLLASGPFD